MDFKVTKKADPRVVNGEWPLSVVETDYPKGKFWSREFWYDWFCDERYLPQKSEKLMGKLLEIVNSPKFDKEKTYTFFKNNCPMWKPGTYDDFRICDIETGNVIYCVANIDKGNWEVFGEGSWSEPLVKGTWNKVRKWFMEER